MLNRRIYANHNKSHVTVIYLFEVFPGKLGKGCVQDKLLYENVCPESNIFQAKQRRLIFFYLNIEAFRGNGLQCFSFLPYL